MRMIRDVCDDGVGKLDICFTEATNDATCEKGPEVCRRNPESDTANIPCHRGQQGAATAISVRKPSNDWGSECLEKREEGAKGTSKENNVIAGVDWASEGILVGIEVMKYTIEQGVWRRVLSAVEGEQRREER